MGKFCQGTEATEYFLNVVGTSQLVNPEILPMASLSDQSWRAMPQ